MNELKNLFKIKQSRKKPKFVRQKSYLIKFRKKDPVWRAPKGNCNKLRVGKKGHSKKPSIGYGAPLKIRGFHNIGLKEFFVSTLKDLEGVDPKENGIVLKAGIGARNKIKILEESKKRKIHIINFKNVDVYIKKIKEGLNENKMEKKIKEEKKIRARKEAEKKFEEKKREEAKPKTEEEKKREEELKKEEERKILEQEG